MSLPRPDGGGVVRFCSWEFPREAGGAEQADMARKISNKERRKEQRRREDKKTREDMYGCFFGRVTAVKSDRIKVLRTVDAINKPHPPFFALSCRVSL